ncbi:MAG: hypothetical protein LBN95_05245 [Prevotellaceae bacterium]|jgi:hypothetical protein|nr:hypothetical protein [Prevotellaceae bacterium]
MCQFFKKTAIANTCGTMERETISKNRVIPKNVRSRGNFLMAVTLFCVVALITSCSTRLATVTTQPRQNEYTITPEMRQFLKTHNNPSIVLRVPNTANRISETEDKVSQAKIDVERFIYNQIEKNLLKAGFTIRDRALLNELLKTGQSDYNAISKTIQTDIIIEILNIDVINNYCRMVNFKNDKGTTSSKENADNIALNPQIVKMEYKLTIVEKGLTGAIFTLYYVPCTDGCDFWTIRKLSKVKPIEDSGYTNHKVGNIVGYTMPIYNTKTRYQDSPTYFFQNYLLWDSMYDQQSIEIFVDYFSSVIADILKGKVDNY